MGRTQKRIDDGMEGDIAIGMPRKPPRLVGERNTAQLQRNTCLQPVCIKPDSDAGGARQRQGCSHARNGPIAQNGTQHDEVAILGQFAIRRIAGHRSHRHAYRRQRGRLVGGFPASHPCRIERGQQDPQPCRLRRLGGAQAVARNGCLHEAVVHPFERVRHGQNRDRGPTLASGGHDGVDQRHTRRGPRGVVDQHKGIA